MKRLLSALILASSLMIAPGAWASDSNGQFVVLAYGNHSCGKWLKSQAKGSEEGRHQQSWIMGFVSAHNESTPGIANLFEGIDTDGAFAWISKHCRENPLEDIYDASLKLVKYLSAQQLPK